MIAPYMGSEALGDTVTLQAEPWAFREKPHFCAPKTRNRLILRCRMASTASWAASSAGSIRDIVEGVENPVATGDVRTIAQMTAAEIEAELDANACSAEEMERRYPHLREMEEATDAAIRDLYDMGIVDTTGRLICQDNSLIDQASEPLGESTC